MTGDIVYYEGTLSPRQNERSKGDSYVNLFAHYRPLGDPQWYLKDNPNETPEQLHDISSSGVSTFVKDLFRQFVSPSGHTLAGPQSLYEYWSQETRKATDSHGFEFSAEL